MGYAKTPTCPCDGIHTVITRDSTGPVDHIDDARSIARISNGHVSVLASTKQRDKRGLQIPSPLARFAEPVSHDGRRDRYNTPGNQSS